MEIGNFEDLVLKLEFEVKNWYMHTKQLPNNLGCHCGVGQLFGGVSYPSFSPFNPSLNFLKFHLNSCLPRLKFSKIMMVMNPLDRSFLKTVQKLASSHAYYNLKVKMVVSELSFES